MKLDVIYTEDCQEGIPKRLPDGCIDLMPTDPPYAIAFMGKKWDTFDRMEDFFIPRWRECLRVLKAGGFAFVMCSPRADVMATQILCLQEAGFMVGFTPIFWAYASGFPKAQNIGKAVDKRLGVKQKVIGEYQAPDGGKRDLSKHKPHKEARQADHQYGYETSGYRPITGATSPQAQALDGSYAGMQLKPAVEVILVAMKPLSEKTYIDQALRNGKGITWLDEGRIPYKSEDKPEGGYGDMEIGIGKPLEHQKYTKRKPRKEGTVFKQSGFKSENNIIASASPLGRFPANLLVSDDVLNDGKIRKNSPVGHKCIGWKHSGNTKDEMTPLEYQPEYGDSGSFSRYFSLDAWFDKKLKELPAGVQKTFPFLIIPKASKSEKNRGCEELYWEKDSSSFGYHQVDKQRWEWLGKEEERIHKETGKRASLRARGNVHPTVKPIKLMSYLITLGSREGDVILDPYIGTGRTAIAATMMRRRYIGFDSSPESVRIAKAALSEVQLRLI